METELEEGEKRCGVGDGGGIWSNEKLENGQRNKEGKSNKQHEIINQPQGNVEALPTRANVLQTDKKNPPSEDIFAEGRKANGYIPGGGSNAKLSRGEERAKKLARLPKNSCATVSALDIL